VKNGERLKVKSFNLSLFTFLLPLLMLTLSTFLTYLSAAFLLAVVPGPGMLYVLTRSLHGGRKEGIQSSLGTAVGGSFHVVAAALGLSAILAASSLAFTIIKYAGAAYLVYLGVRMLLEKHELDLAESPSTTGNPFAQGIITEMLNPKTALFFLSFIPQFVDLSSGNVTLQFILLGSISVFLNTSADLIVTFFAGPIGERLRSSVRWQRRQRVATGSAMIGLGVYVAFRR
jgi:threonine/homoserine/homoserine lactone efflux protein